MNVAREARFYAWMAFDHGDWSTQYANTKPLKLDIKNVLHMDTIPKTLIETTMLPDILTKNSYLQDMYVLSLEVRVGKEVPVRLFAWLNFI